MVKFVDNPNGHCRMCIESDEKGVLVECCECDRWFHLACVGLKDPPRSEDYWTCQKCYEIAENQQKMEEKLKKLEAQAKGKRTPSSERTTTTEEILRIHQKTMEALVKQLQVKPEPTPDISLAQPNQNEDWTIYLKRQALADLPRFDGAPKDWPKFKKTYEETTKAGAFTNLENLNRLQKVLRGNAAKTVSQLLIDPENVKKIIERLEETYGRPEAIYNELLHELIKIRKENKSALLEIADALDNLVSTINVINCAQYLNDPRLVDTIVKKLPYNIQIKWAEELSKENIHCPDLKILNELIKPLAKIQRMVNPSIENSERKSRVNIHQDNRKKFYNKCPFCEKDHKVYECDTFKKMNTEARRKIVTQKRLCFGCLGANHLMKDCERARTCDIDKCQEKHSRWLHPRNKKNVDKANKMMTTPKEEIVEKLVTTENASSSNSGTTNHHQTFRNNIYFQIIPITLRNKGKEVNTFAFLDAGSSLTLIEEQIADDLGLKGRSNLLKLTWTQNVTKQSNSRQVQVTLVGPSKKPFILKGVRTIDNLQLPIQSLDMDAMKKQYDHLKDLPIESYTVARPSILIGLDNAHLLMPMDRRMLDENSPMAMRTKLGWFLFGNLKLNIAQDYVMAIQENDEMRNMMMRYLSTEDFGVKTVESLPKGKEDKRVEEIINDTLKYLGNRYEIGMLFRQDDVKFPDTYQNALRRLTLSEKMLAKNEKLKQWAILNFKEYVAKGYARKLTPAELLTPTNKVYYLPHFIVINQNKNKPRLVFDAKAEVKGVSLNSTLLPEPDATTSIFGILLRFREGNIAISGDIQEMFHQVRIRPEDQHVLRFLWRDCDTSKPPEVYVMMVMIFGATCSPACAQIVKNFNARKFEKTHPAAATAIVKQHYVDDYLDSFHTQDEAVQTVNDVITIHEKGGFFIRNFISNKRELLHSLPENRLMDSNKKDITDKESHVERVLGLHWNTQHDYFSYQLRLDKLNAEALKTLNTPTKREVLSFVMSIYDPLGLISHKIIEGKIILQELHKESMEWDDTITSRILPRWRNWISTLKLMGNLKIPRSLHIKIGVPLELHTFVDSSENAFAAVIDIKCGNTVSLVAAKSRVAPIKTLSIPRLELQAAVLGSRLAETIVNEIRPTISKKIYWSDSQTVLAWIRSDHRKYKPFVAHRIGEILDTTTVQQWRWVPSLQNPADEATKEVKRKSIWINGPGFLHLQENNWPTQKPIEETSEESKDILALHITTEIQQYDFIRENRYSNYWKLVQHLCILKKFVNWIAERKHFIKAINRNDRDIVENTLYKKAQWEAFPVEMMDLIKNKQLTKQGPLSSLRPVLDENGVMRSRGRRGKVSHMYSDNGTNFIGAWNEIKELQAWANKINTTMEKGQSAALEIQWSFNPPAAPHFGGAWERSIKIIKTSLKNMFKSCKRPTPELLRAGLIQAEFLLNSRPLTHIPLETFDDEVLTPFHMLIGRAGEHVSPIAPTVDGFNKEQWKLAQHYGQLFWDRWKTEYLPTLIKRNKWTEEIIPLEENDIVIITDDNVPAGRWLKGRIIKTYPDKDGQVRKADIQTEKGIIKRAATKIAVLDVTQKEKPEDAQHLTSKNMPEEHVMIIHNDVSSKDNVINNNKSNDSNPNNDKVINTKRKLEDENFSNWGKRNKLDIDKIKELRDQHLKKHPPRTTPKRNA
ncbi:uncharacterized protein LOC129728441 [Wyeomyia smithii]|uniref:uncharacterized protein LOC129728441 n=1 Tax=Wyeomyia smithii TaxID=174621 RepID=UPI002467ECE9|nr:uncharacterized protein LOC129728441 [Wyeomyia smithii]